MKDDSGRLNDVLKPFLKSEERSETRFMHHFISTTINSTRPHTQQLRRAARAAGQRRVARGLPTCQPRHLQCIEDMRMPARWFATRPRVWAGLDLSQENNRRNLLHWADEWPVRC